MGCCGGPQQCRDFDSDAEGLSASDLARFGGDDAECRNCGETFYADAPMCPRCGEAVLDSDAGGSGKRGILFPLAVAVMIGALVVLVTL